MPSTHPYSFPYCKILTSSRHCELQYIVLHIVPHHQIRTSRHNKLLRNIFLLSTPSRSLSPFFRPRTNLTNMSVSVAGKQAGPIGFGLMGTRSTPSPQTVATTKLIFSAGLTRPPPLPYNEASKVMKEALDRGANFWNGAQFYGPPTANSLQLLNHYFTTYPEDRDKVVLSIKGAFSLAGPDNSTTGIRKSVDNCLEILDGKVFLDIFLPGRIDPQVPIEETVRALAEYVKVGKIGGYGLSECSAETIRRAHVVHPISAVEIELSLFSTDTLRNGVAQTCSELKIPLVAYSPLSRGFLTGQINKLDDIPENDARRRFPRFQPDVFDLNLKLAKEVEQLATKTGYTMPQVAIAWITAQTKKMNNPVIPIPGCTTVARVEENLTQVSLNKQDFDELSQMVEKMTVHGDRYPEPFKKYMDL
jgi:pyridoxine 4-dehydrogenase